MKKCALFFLVLTSSFLFSQNKRQIPLELWVLPNENNLDINAHKIASQSWNFEVKVLEGVFAKMLGDSLEPHNEALWKQLEADGISNAKEKYQTDVEKEKKPLAQAINISLSEKYVTDIYSKIKSQKRRERTEIQKVTNQEYRFMIYSYSEKTLKEKEKLETRFIVNIKDQTIRIFK